MPPLPPVPLDVRRSLELIREQVHETFDRWRHAVGRGRGEQGLVSVARPVYRGPDLDVEETDDTVIVRAELPGLRHDDFTVEATADRLMIRGEKAEEREHGGRGFHRVERRYGSFMRSVALPCEVEAERAAAQYRDGVLRVTLPKTEAAKARRILVTVGSR